MSQLSEDVASEPVQLKLSLTSKEPNHFAAECQVQPLQSVTLPKLGFLLMQRIDIESA
jgi:hypothetical protein